MRAMSLSMLLSVSFIYVLAVPQILHRYSFNEEAGDIACDSVGGPMYNGMINGEITLTGNSMNISSDKGSYLLLPTNVCGVTSTTAITVEMWVSTPPSYGRKTATLFIFGEQFSDANSLKISRDDNGFIEATINAVHLSSDVSCDNWNDTYLVFVFVIDQNIVYIYIDGSLTATLTATASIDPPDFNDMQFNYIGLTPNTQNLDTYSGLVVDEFRVWSGQLESEAVTKHFNDGADTLTDYATLSPTPAPTFSSLSSPNVTLLNRYNFSVSSVVGDHTYAEEVEGSQIKAAILLDGAVLSDGKVVFDCPSGTCTTLPHVQLPGNLFRTSSIISLEWWFSTGSTMKTEACLFSLSNSPNYQNHDFKIENHDSAYMNRVQIRIEGKDFPTAVPFTNLTNVHMVLVIKPNVDGYVYLYVNGVLSFRHTYTAVLPDSPEDYKYAYLGLADYDNKNVGFDGSIDEFRAWSGELTWDMVFQHYQSGPNNLIIDKSTTFAPTPVPTSGIGSETFLLHRYSFNDTGSDIAEDSVGGTRWDGALQGTANIHDGSLFLTYNSNDEVNAFVILPEGVLGDMTNSKTFEVWLDIGADTDNNPSIFTFAHSGSGTNVRCYENFGNVYVSYHSDGFNFVTPFYDWVGLHLVVVLTLTLRRVYMNGVLVNTQYDTVSAITDSLIINYIGKGPHDDDPSLTGSIDEFRIWNGELSSAVVERHFKAGPDVLDDDFPTPFPTQMPTPNPTMSPTANPTTYAPTEYPTSTPSCGDGHYIYHGNCGVCPVGYYSSEGNTCEPCPSGFYGDVAGAEFCQKCEWPTTTDDEGSVSCNNFCFCLSTWGSVIVWVVLISVYFFSWYAAGETKAIFPDDKEVRGLAIFANMIIPALDHVTNIIYILETDFKYISFFLILVACQVLPSIGFGKELRNMEAVPLMWWCPLVAAAAEYEPVVDIAKLEYPLMSNSGAVDKGKLLWQQLQDYAKRTICVGYHEGYPTWTGYPCWTIIRLSEMFVTHQTSDPMQNPSQLLSWIFSWIFICFAQILLWICVLLWNFLLYPIFMAFWFALGILFYQTRTIAVGKVRKMWLKVYSGSDDNEAGAVPLDTGVLNECLISSLIIDTVPHLVIQIWNNLLIGEYTVFMYFSTSFSAYMTISGIWQFLYWKVYIGKKLYQIPINPMLPFFFPQPLIDYFTLKENTNVRNLKE